MAKLPFQQTQVLPGTKVGGFQTSGISPPPSLQGVIDSGRQFYGAQMDVAESMMDLGQTIAKAVMIDNNEEKRKHKIAVDDFEDVWSFDYLKRDMQIRRQHEDNPAAYDNILKNLLKTRTGADRPKTDAEGRSYLERIEDLAREKGFSNSEIQRVSRNIQRLGIRTNIEIWQASRDQEELGYKRLRFNSENKRLNKFIKELYQSELKILTKESGDLTPGEITGLKNTIKTLVKEVVTEANGFTGKWFPTPESRELEEERIEGEWGKILLQEGRKWNHTELGFRIEKENLKETQAYTKAHNKLVDRISNSMVLEIANEERDYTYQRTDIKNAIPTIVSEEAWDLYPKDIDEFGHDKNLEKRSEFIEDSNIKLEELYFDANAQLKLKAVERAVQFRKEDEQEKARIKNMENNVRRREADIFLTREIINVRKAFEEDKIDSVTAKDRANTIYTKIYDKFKRVKREGGRPLNEKEKLFNRNLAADLLKKVESDANTWVLAEVFEKEALDKEQKAIEEHERAKHLRRQTQKGVTRYTELAAGLFHEQQTDPKDHEDFKKSLEAVKGSIIRDFAGDPGDFEANEEFADGFDQELAESIDAELSNVIIQHWDQVASKQKSDQVTLDASRASIEYIYGNEKNPGLNSLLAQAFEQVDANGNSLSWDETNTWLQPKLKQLEDRVKKNVKQKSNRALHLFVNSSELLEHKEAKLQTLENQITERQDEQLKLSLERRMNDVATGRDLGQFKAPPRTFRDAQNLLTNRQESDWRMVHIANLLEPHVGGTEEGELYSRDEAILILSQYAERIDRADALGMIERDPVAALEALKPVSFKDKDAFFPNLQPEERKKLENQARNAIKNAVMGERADYRNRYNNEIKRVLAGDYQSDDNGMPVGEDFTFMDRVIKPLVGDKSKGFLYSEYEYEIMQNKMQYAREISKAVHGGDSKYGTEPLEYKTAEQLQALLTDFKPGTYDAGFVKEDKRYDVPFMHEVYNSFAQGVGRIKTKRSTDPAFFPAERWKEMMEERGAQVNMFSRERAEYIIEQQEAYAPGSEPKLFTNFELQKIDDQWNDLGGEGRGGMLAEMEMTVSDPKIFNQMFYDIAENTDINDSDQMYLVHHGNGAILRRLHTAQSLDMASINVKLGNQETDLETFDVELYKDEDLKQYMAAFFDEPRKMKDWYNLVRSYSIVGMKDGDAEEEIELTVRHLLSSKFHVHSGNHGQEEIDGTSIWLPKKFIPDRPADLGETKFDLITKDDFTKSLHKFITEEVPALVGEQTYVALAAEAYHFRNSDDGQGLTLHYLDDTGSYLVADKNNNPIQINWDQLMSLIETRVLPSPVESVWPGTSPKEWNVLP